MSFQRGFPIPSWLSSLCSFGSVAPDSAGRPIPSSLGRAGRLYSRHHVISFPDCGIPSPSLHTPQSTPSTKSVEKRREGKSARNGEGEDLVDFSWTESVRLFPMRRLCLARRWAATGQRDVDVCRDQRSTCGVCTALQTEASLCWNWGAGKISMCV